MAIKKGRKDAYQDEEVGEPINDDDEETKDFADDFDVIKEMTDVHEQKKENSSIAKDTTCTYISTTQATTYQE